MDYQIQEIDNNIIILCNCPGDNEPNLAIVPLISRLLIQSLISEQIENNSTLKEKTEQLYTIKQLVQLQVSQVICDKYKLNNAEKESKSNNLIDISELNDSIISPHQWIETNGFICDTLPISAEDFDIFNQNVAIHWLIDNRIAQIQHPNTGFVVITFIVNMYIVDTQFNPQSFADYSQLHGWYHQFNISQTNDSIFHQKNVFNSNSANNRPQIDINATEFCLQTIKQQDYTNQPLMIQMEDSSNNSESDSLIEITSEEYYEQLE